ncbi:DegT/DnrJ/EryC1/StrS family aminotransferase [Hoeflea sp. AS16]|uniref:DegT/DnrJ/EryC1/StrS family aminotransferase n=1 Tax=Hoeflea sp. AS16 TaxID=3135779 RepID=UPI00316FD898
MKTRPNIPWAKAEFWGSEEKYVIDALRSSWISGGPYVERLEAACAEFLGVPHAIAVSNGTAALDLSFLALDIQPGDEIIVPGFAFMAAANLALQKGAIPVFCDVDPLTWCIQPKAVEKLISKQTRAIVAVHSYGNMCDVPGLVDLAAAHDIALIEDAAEAFGSKMDSLLAGTQGHINTFSFHATKTVTTGEGGLVTTHDSDLAEKMRLYRSHGLRRHRHYWHELPGHNFRLTNLQAAMGVAQMEKIETILDHRVRMYQRYKNRIQSMPGTQMQMITETCEAAIWAVALRLDATSFPQGRDEVMSALSSRGIETRPGFQPPAEMDYFGPTSVPVSENLGRWVISLPSYPSLTDSEIDYICNELAKLSKAG